MMDVQKSILFTIAIDALPQDMENPGKIVIFFMKNNRGRLGVKGLRAGEMVDDSNEKISGDDSKENMIDTSDEKIFGDDSKENMMDTSDEKISRDDSKENMMDSSDEKISRDDSKENMMDTSDSKEVELTDNSRPPLDGLQTDVGNLERSDEDSDDDTLGQDVSSITDDDSKDISSLTTDTIVGTSDDGRDDSKEEKGVLQDEIIPLGNIMEKGDDGRDDSNDDDGGDGVKTTSKELVTGENIDLPDMINSDIESVQRGEILATDANRDIEVIGNVQNLNENTDDGIVKDDGEQGQED